MKCHFVLVDFLRVTTLLKNRCLVAGVWSTLFQTELQINLLSPDLQWPSNGRVCSLMLAHLNERLNCNLTSKSRVMTLNALDF